MTMTPSSKCLFLDHARSSSSVILHLNLIDFPLLFSSLTDALMWRLPRNGTAKKEKKMDNELDGDEFNRPELIQRTRNEINYRNLINQWTALLFRSAICQQSTLPDRVNGYIRSNIIIFHDTRNFQRRSFSGGIILA